MASPSSAPGNSPIAAGMRPSQQAQRQPLGLPAGSVRAILTFIILALIWTLMLLPKDKVKDIPLYLFYLMFLSLGSFFAAHGRSIAGPLTGTRSPLYLPRGSLRTLIILGFAGVLGWKYYETRDLSTLLEMKPPQSEVEYLPLVLLAAFFAGIFVSRVIGRMLTGPSGTPPWFQDILAWVALLSTICLGAEAMIQLVINPGLPPERQLSVPQLQIFLAAITGFYFGARS